MPFGARLVIPGTLLVSFLLAFFLYSVTAGISLASAAAAAPQPPDQAPAQQIAQAAAASGEVIPLDPETVDASDIDSNAALEACQLSAAFPQAVLQYCGLISHYATKRGLPPDLVASLIVQESGGNSNAYSKSGAVGLMQIMPRDGLASSFMCINGPCFADRPSTDELWNAEFNISYGTKLLAQLFNKYGNFRDALKSYGPMDVGYYYADIVLGHMQRYTGQAQ